MLLYIVNWKSAIRDWLIVISMFLRNYQAHKIPDTKNTIKDSAKKCQTHGSKYLYELSELIFEDLVFLHLENDSFH